MIFRLLARPALLRSLVESHGWFAAYAPADDPQIAVAVVIENGGCGSRSAAPVVRKVFDYYFGINYETDDTAE